MNESTSNQLNGCDLDDSSEMHQFDETSCVMDEKFVPKVGMIFKTLEEARKFYKYYSKLDGFFTKIRNTTRDRNKIKNQLIVCSREGRWKSKISPTLKTNPSAGLNCPARIYVHIMKDVGLWTIFKIKLERFPHKVWSRRQQVAFRAVRGSAYIDSGLLGSPLLRRDEKHKKERDNTTIAFQAEREFDAADFHTVIPCATKSAMEAQFQHVYTHEKFREVQAQFRVSRDVKCHCLLFESRGILCRHSLSILIFERVDNVAPKYILERWSKNIKKRHTHIKSSQDEPVLEPRSKRFDELVFRSHNICEFTSESEDLTRILHRAFDKVMAEMEEYQERRKGKSFPPRIKTRGQPKNRLGSNLEKKISNAMKKKKKTAPSKLNLLHSESSIQSSSTLYNTPYMNYPRQNFTIFRFV
ncbi:hypothetical protein Ahy_A10g047598 [Arachis hypogaea]|uniref:Protein FAR1-RELATED SEQUENCE n=1 Tax=Arachis hypogaea TaxID=3818 RepID=A0A445B320_ARAHY|nr:hypothetical protein Ahy_A10g047598 [Arachis hypogaea]